MKKSDLFRIALSVKSARLGERYTANRFCDELSISSTFLHMVLDGTGTSARVSDAVDELIRENVGPFQDQLARIAA